MLTIGRTFPPPPRSSSRQHPIPQSKVPSGFFAMGDNSSDRNRGDGEVPLHRVALPAFSIDAITVTNNDFSTVVADTGGGWEFEVRTGGIPAGGTRPSRGGVGVRGAWRPRRREVPLGMPPWTPVHGARTSGRESSLAPARSKTAGWPPRQCAPSSRTAAVGDSASGTWCSGWFDPSYYGASPEQSPRGSEHGDSRVLRGGSYICHTSYCNRYRNSARSQNTPDSSMGNAGFRTVAL